MGVFSLPTLFLFSERSGPRRLRYAVIFNLRSPRPISLNHAADPAAVETAFVIYSEVKPPLPQVQSCSHLYLALLGFRSPRCRSGSLPFDLGVNPDVARGSPGPRGAQPCGRSTSIGSRARPLHAPLPPHSALCPPSPSAPQRHWDSAHVLPLPGSLCPYLVVWPTARCHFSKPAPVRVPGLPQGAGPHLPPAPHITTPS